MGINYYPPLVIRVCLHVVSKLPLTLFIGGCKLFSNNLLRIKDFLFKTKVRGVMYQFFSDQEKYLYHYTSSNIAIHYILKDKTLKIGKYINTNDPKETKDWQFFVGSNEGHDLSKYNLDEISKKVTQALKHRANVICFSKDRILSGDHIKDIFNRGFCKARMWAQYGDNHRGVCLIFDKSALNIAISNQFLNDFDIYGGSVTYKNRLIVEYLSTSSYGINIDYLERLRLEKYVKAHIYTHHKRLFFEKSEDWSNEDEFRWVLFSNKEEDVYLRFGNSLAGVVFGDSCSDDDISKVVEQCQGWGVQFERIVWKNCSPWFSFRLCWV
jgi:hypothetical protein